MDWQGEARALINDIRNHVSNAEVLPEHESNDKRTYLLIETLEKRKLVVLMDVSGFIICDTEATDDNCGESEPVSQVYETIYALLDHNSPMYRVSFAKALINKMESLE